MLRKEIKRKMIAGLKDEELLSLKFSEKDISKKLKWEHSKEFEFDGQMYDVVKINKTKDSVEYKCWWDAEESNLNKKLMVLVANRLSDLPASRELNLQLTNFYKNFYYKSLITLNNTDNLIFISDSGTHVFIDSPDLLLVGFQNMQFPPPEIF